MTETIERIPLDSITPHTGNRKVGGFDESALSQLAESIRTVGVQQPAVVRKKGKGYELVAGERRWRASRLAGLDYLPCVVRDLDDAQTLKIQVVENLQREDVHPLDEADGYERLRVEGGYAPELIAQEVGRSVTYIYQRLRLRKLIPEARQLLAEGDIQAAHAVLVARLGQDQQRELVGGRLSKQALENRSMTARELDEYIRETIMLSLKRAQWKLDDATLHPARGACSDCAWRTGSDPALFADIADDACTDAACHKAKEEALIARRRKELAGAPHLVVMERYDYMKKHKGVLDKEKWEECRKKDDGALPCLVIDGDSPGRLTYGRKTETQQAPAREKGVPTAEQKAKAEEVRVRAEAHRETNRRLFLAVERAVGRIDPPLVLRTYALALIEGSYNGLDKLADHYGLERDGDSVAAAKAALFEFVQRGPDHTVLAFIVARSIYKALDVSPWESPIVESLGPWLDPFAIDAQAIRAEVHAELGLPLGPDASGEEEDDEDPYTEQEDDES